MSGEPASSLEESEQKINDETGKETDQETHETSRDTLDVRPRQFVDSSGGAIKVELMLKPVADAPIMKQKKWMVPGSQTVGWVNNFVNKLLKVPVGDSLFLYVNQSFVPTPDHTMQNLLDCFGSDGKVVLHYSKTPAWG